MDTYNKIKLLLSEGNLVVRDLQFIGDRRKNRVLRDLRLTDA